MGRRPHLDSCGERVLECDFPREQDDEGEGEAEDEGKVGDEEVKERPAHGHEHLHVLAEARHLPNQEHLQHPRDEDPDAGCVKLPTIEIDVTWKSGLVTLATLHKMCTLTFLPMTKNVTDKTNKD